MVRKISMGQQHAIVLTARELSTWAGRTLTEDELERLAECIEHSSIPEAVATIVAGFGIVPDEALPGTSGQDRESYSDTQDRDSYIVE